jgi:hypothetical protein
MCGEMRASPRDNPRRRSAADWGLLVRSWLMLGTARLALWVLPLRVARRCLAWAAHAIATRGASPDRIAWAISRTQRLVPHATCLPQALAAEALLRHAGHPADLRIGVAKTGPVRLVAHAWVESRGRIVVGDLGESLAGYSPLPPLPSSPPLGR